MAAKSRREILYDKSTAGGGVDNDDDAPLPQPPEEPKSPNFDPADYDWSTYKNGKMTGSFNAEKAKLNANGREERR